MIEAILILGAFGLGFACGRAPDATIRKMGQIVDSLKWWKG